MRLAWKEMEELIRPAVEAGWELTRRGSGHLCLRCPASGRKVFFTGTRTDRRGVQNVRAQLRRAGAPIP